MYRWHTFWCCFFKKQRPGSACYWKSIGSHEIITVLDNLTCSTWQNPLCFSCPLKMARLVPRPQARGGKDTQLNSGIMVVPWDALRGTWNLWKRSFTGKWFFQLWYPGMLNQEVQPLCFCNSNSSSFSLCWTSKQKEESCSFLRLLILFVF